MVLKWNRKQQILGTGRLYEIKVDVRLYYIKSFHAKCKFHDYTKVKLWNGFGVKWKWLIAKFYCYIKSKPLIVCNGWQKSEIWKKLKENWKENSYYIECRVKHCFRNSHLVLLRNENAPRLIRNSWENTILRSEKFFSNLRMAAFSTNCFLLPLK